MKPLQNPFAKYTLLQRYFAKVKSSAKPFCKGEPANMQKSQCLQGFQLLQNTFAKPFAKPFRAFFCIALAKYPPHRRWGVLQNQMQRPRMQDRQKKITCMEDTP